MTGTVTSQNAGNPARFDEPVPVFASGRYQSIAEIDKEDLANSYRLRQTERGAFSSSFRRVRFSNFFVDFLFIGVSTFLETAPNFSQIWLTVPIAAEKSFYWNGFEVDRPSVLLNAGHDVSVRRGGALTSVCFAIDRSLLAQNFTQLGPSRAVENAMQSTRVFPAHVGDLGALARQFATGLAHRSSRQSYAVANGSLRRLIVGRCVRLLTSGLADDGMARRHGRAQAIAGAAAERIEADLSRRLSTATLAQDIGVSVRSLQLAFETIYGISPLRYVKIRRLHETQRRLLLARPTERSAVKRAALGAGLTELGRFSVEYREFFGESPSQTLLRAPRAAATDTW